MICIHVCVTQRSRVLYEKQYLSITEMARRRSITTETLRYYDRIGLLKPDYLDSNRV